jgi:hypothetical protein
MPFKSFFNPVGGVESILAKHFVLETALHYSLLASPLSGTSSILAIICSPNEDFGMPTKHSGTYFQSNFQMNVAQN